MHPVLFEADWLRLPTYFTCLMVGFSLASFVLRREAVRRGLAPRLLMDLALLVVPLALIGSRIAHVVLVDSVTWQEDPTRILWGGGGFVFYGGAAGGLLSIAVWAWWTGRSAWVYGDCLAPATAFGLAWGRLGCLGGGCCHGKPADWPFGVEVPWSVMYTRASPVSDVLQAVPLHPAPLYASVFAMALFVLLSRIASRQRYDGQVMAAFLVVYGLGRIGLEAVRADVARGLYLGGWLSTSQIVSLGAVLLGLVLMRTLGRRPPQHAAVEPRKEDAK
jgi:phosphatidylglycerol---prolipoprotein diacylglyceryl transferase